MEKLTSTVACEWIGCTEIQPHLPRQPVPEHRLIETEKLRADGRKQRKRCIGCYDKLRKGDKDRKEAMQKASTVTTECKEYAKPFSLECFNSKHSQI